MSKMQLVDGVVAREIVSSETASKYFACYDLTVEATGATGGIRTSLAITRPLGTLVLKSTVATPDPKLAAAESGHSLPDNTSAPNTAADASKQPEISSSSSPPCWSELANDIVVNEKRLVGSRCGPFDMALRMLEQESSVRKLVNAMTHGVYPIAEQGIEAIQHAGRKGTLKIQLQC